MKILKFTLLLSACLLTQTFSFAEEQQQDKDPKKSMNMDAVHSRPLSQLGTSSLSIGGYVESHWQYYATEGVTEGHQFMMPRMTLFFSSAISDRIKFMSELEFEDGGSTIAIEFAAVDFEFHPLFNLRGGIIMNPIGAFNQNHDGPKWEFAERPVAMNRMLPATWSTVGFGAYGKLAKEQWVFGYEAYLTGGFDEAIINNTLGKTYLPASKPNVARFEEMASGQPTYTGKIAIKHREIGELGLSYMGGLYNNTTIDGEKIDDERAVHIAAIDFNTEFPFGTKIIAELAHIWVDLPANYTPEYGGEQFGGFVDVIHPIYKGKLLKWENTSLNLALRAEYVDWNRGYMKDFPETKKGEDMWSIMPGISFRPGPRTVVRFAYRFREDTDFLNNPAEKAGGFTLGFSTYF